MNKNEYRILLKQAGTIELTDAERKKINGSFINLPIGNTHYELKGKGETIVLIHGYATPYYIYDKLFDFFTENGYRVLRYDLLGRGFSERIDADYTPELFAQQLYELSEALLKDTEDFYLVGTSMGGSICAEFCKNHPEKVKKLALLAPAGMDTFKPPFYMKLSTVPVIGTAIFNIIGNATLLKNCAREMYNCDAEERELFERKFAEAIKYNGFLKCTLSSLKNTILRTDKTIKSYIATAENKIPILCIWGTADKTMPYYQTERLKQICPQATLITYENSGHIFVYDEGERTANDVAEFIYN